MNVALQATALASLLLVAALLGPAALRHASPALSRAPRFAVGLLTGAVAAWLLGVLALGPMLAWLLTGPALLPQTSAEVCQRCLVAANPTAGPFLHTGLPVILLIAIPAAAAALYGGSVVAGALRHGRAARRSAEWFTARGTQQTVLGHRGLVVDDAEPIALSLPARHGGIVVSTGTLAMLDADELAAVLAHEEAHVRQHHHLVRAVMSSLAHRLSWVPLVAAASEAVGHYLEIAADDAARRRTGTDALASALLTLGQSRPHVPAVAHAGVLHAAGPDRVRHLVRPVTGTAGVVAAVTVTACLAGLAALGLSVHASYALAVVSGCA